jgi:hypothetical protein
MLEAVSATPPLGSFCLVDLDGGAAAVDALIDPLHKAPWVPVVVVQRSGKLSADVLHALEAVPGVPAFVLKRPDESLPLTILGQDAVRGRPPVDADRAAAYVANRAGRPNLAPSLTVAMAMPPRQGFFARFSAGSRWLARQLRGLSPLTAADWRDVFYLATAAGNTHFTTADAAERLRLDVWTIRRRLDRLAGITTDQYRLLAGWEWFLEAVVRRHVRP